MAAETVIDAAHLPRFHRGPEAPLWWGILGLVTIEATVLGTFIASYLYYAAMLPQWPPPEYRVPSLLRPTLTLVLLLGSCATMFLAGRALSHDRRKPFLIYLWLSVLLASSTLVLRWQQLEVTPFGWSSHAYGSMFWTLSAFHFMHVVSAVIGTMVVALLGMLGFFNSRRQLAVVVDTFYWYFVSFAWAPLYAVLYLHPLLA